MAGVTAYASVRAVRPKEGETVVVSGAAGGVGSLTAQLARNAGAHVLGVAGEANAAWLRSIGVTPVAYGDGLADRLRAAAPGGIDAFLDTYGNGYVSEALPYAARAATVAGAHTATWWNAQLSLASCHLAIAEDVDLAEATRISAEVLAKAGSEQDRRTAHTLEAHVHAAELFGTGELPEARAALLAAPDPSCLRLLRAIADRRGETVIADELSHLMLVLAWADGPRQAWAEQDAEVARLTHALDDLGSFLRELHGQA